MDIQIHKEYFFYLHSYIYISYEGKSNVLLYNTKKNTSYICVDKEIRKHIEDISDPKNLGVIKLHGQDIVSNKLFNDFINEMTVKEFGALEDTNKFPVKPIILLPILHLADDIDKFNDNNLPLKDISKYLSVINIYLNNSCTQKCKNCNSYYKQFNCCTKYFKDSSMDINILKNIFYSIERTYVKCINILGGNILLYENIKELSNIIGKYKECTFHLWINYLNFYGKENTPLFAYKNVIKNIIFTFPLDIKEIISFISKKRNVKTKFYFIIQNINELESVEEIINKTKIQKYTIYPFYNGSNLIFFRNNVFLNADDILNGNLSMREIFCNQKMNSNYFGKITIIPDGTVKSNIHEKALGNIKDDNLLRLIYKELMDNTSWRKIRDQKPCSECLFQYLCPPISNYEYALGRNALCNIKPIIAI